MLELIALLAIGGTFWFFKSKANSAPVVTPVSTGSNPVPSQPNSNLGISPPVIQVVTTSSGSPSGSQPTVHTNYVLGKPVPHPNYVIAKPSFKVTYAQATPQKVNSL